MLPGKQYTPQDYVAMVWRRKWLVMAGLILGTYVALIVSSQLPDMFQSEMLVQVVPQRVPDDFIKSTVTLRTTERLSALSEQIMSRTELERLVVDMNLFPSERATMPMQDVIELMRSRVVVEPVRSMRNSQDPESFYIRFSYPDPVLAKTVTERLGALFIEVNARDRGNMAQATQGFLETQLQEARRLLEEQENRLQRFRERHTGSLPSQLQFNMSAMSNSQLEIQTVVESLARDRDRKLMLERLYNDAQNEIVMSDPSMTAPVQVAQAPGGQTPAPAQAAGGDLRQQLAMARQALAALELRLKPEHPDIVRTKRVVNELETRLAQEIKLAEAREKAGTPAPPPPVAITPQETQRRERLQQMRAEIESLQRQIEFKEVQEQRARDTLREFQRRIEIVPGLESEWMALSRDYDTQQAAYKDLLTKSESAKLASNLEERQIGEQFKVLDPAGTPVRPTGIDRLQVNAAGAGIGLVLGLLLALGLELRNSTYESANDLTQILQLPVLALIPVVVTAADRAQQQVRRRIVSGAVASATAVGAYGFWALELWKHIR